ncbi:MAG: exodeoxyribonuclease III [Chloroflexi bacterium]|nr:exodeoxyribonuclease III [Chloroflexota bacterium]
MRIATWNINGLKERHEELLRWLQDNEPDVMGLQEIKTENAIRLNRFRDDLQKMGYHAEFHSEARYRGVAILSKWPLDVTRKGLPGQTGLGARLLSASTAGWSFTTVCVPYKPGIGGPKLTWLDSLSNYLRTRADGASPAVLCGDFNIAPAPIDNGVYQPKGQPDERRIGHRSEEQSCIRSLQEAGWFDLVRKANPGCRMFSYWHKPELYHQNKGLRTDLAFGDHAACERLQAAKTDRSPLDQRPKDKRQDHAPVIVDLA